MTVLSPEIGATTVSVEDDIHTNSYNNQCSNLSENAVYVNFNNGNVNNNNHDNNNYVLAFSANSGFTLQQVYDAYFECRKRKANKPQARKFEKQYMKKIRKLWIELNTKQYKISQSTCFVVDRPKPREVFAAKFVDRIIHHLVIRELKPYFEEYFIENSFSCREGKGTLAAQIELYEQLKKTTNNFQRKDLYYGKFDFQSFFMNIDKRILYKKLEEFINQKYHKPNKELLLWLVKLIVFNCPQNDCIRTCSKQKWNKLPSHKTLFNSSIYKGLPIGNLTSQWFANFYLTEFDKWASEQFPSYVRYVDDIVIIGERNKIRNFYRNAQKYVKHLGLQLNPNKIYIQKTSKGISFLGAYFKVGRVYISNRIMGNLFRKIRNYKVNEQVINSYLGMLSHYKSYFYIEKIKKYLPKDLTFKNKTYVVYRTK